MFVGGFITCEGMSQVGLRIACPVEGEPITCDEKLVRGFTEFRFLLADGTSESVEIRTEYIRGEAGEGFPDGDE